MSLRWSIQYLFYYNKMCRVFTYDLCSTTKIKFFSKKAVQILKRPTYYHHQISGPTNHSRF